MRLRTVFRMLLIGLLSLSVFGLQSPAEATTVGALTFQGTASVVPGLRSPGVGDVPDGVLDPLANGPESGWEFSSDVCADLAANVDKPGKDPLQVGVTCSISASGTLNGWCGRSHGQTEDVNGDGIPDKTGVYIDSSLQEYSFSVKWQSAGGTLVITGEILKDSTGQTGPLSAVVQATPVGGSCSETVDPDNAATDFLVTGVALAVVM